jgi:uncharacterized protein involved in exopolysaccharide biosynthesis
VPSQLPDHARAAAPSGGYAAPDPLLSEGLVAPSAERESPPLSLAGWCAATLRRWRTVLWMMLAAALVAGAAMLLVPAAYRSEASFVANAGSGMKLPGSLAGAAALAGVAAQLGVSPGSDPSESPAFYMQLLASRELRTRLLLSRFPDPRPKRTADSATLFEILDIHRRDPKRAFEIALKNIGKAIAPRYDLKTNLVSFTVDAEYPELSAQVANRVIALVTRFNLEQRRSRAQEKREFTQARRAEAQAALASAEHDLRAFYEVNREWRLSPTLSFEEGRLRRQVDIASDLFLNLQREFETARINEVNDAALITVVDTAVAARRPEWPRPVVLFPAALIVGALVGVALAGIAALLADWARRNPEEAGDVRGAWAQLRSELFGRRRRRANSVADSTARARTGMDGV